MIVTGQRLPILNFNVPPVGFRCGHLALALIA